MIIYEAGNLLRIDQARQAMADGPKVPILILSRPGKIVRPIRSKFGVPETTIYGVPLALGAGGVRALHERIVFLKLYLKSDNS